MLIGADPILIADVKNLQRQDFHLKYILILNKTEKPFSLQDDEKEGTIMTELVKFFTTVQINNSLRNCLSNSLSNHLRNCLSNYISKQLCNHLSNNLK